MNEMHFLLVLTIFLSLKCNTVEVPDIIDESIPIDIRKQTKSLSENPGGVVSCWLMDSDVERPRKISFVNAMKDMGVQFIRFPYGHLADNYLWDADGDWGNILTPKVATMSQAPGVWNWAVNPSTEEFIQDMDFDEYISICNEVGAEPMVVVNILSYKYKNGPSYEQLKETAVEWVKYANITKKYSVKRWALGNEVDHHADLISQEEYKALYSDFAKAMKEIDPSIMIGPGLLGNWHAALLSHDPANIDFICAHNYLYKYDWRNQDYEGWKNATDILVGNVEKCQNAVNNSSIPDTEIHVTEMNSRPWSDKSDADDLFRALAYGEMMLNAISFEDVIATYVWNTHGPWGGPDENAPYNVLDLDNNREPRGDVMKLLNENLLDHLVEVQRVHGFLRMYASVSDELDELAIIIINKNDKEDKTVFKPSNFHISEVYEMQSYYGNDPYDDAPTLSKMENYLINKELLEVKMPPVSINVVRIKINIL